MGNEIKSAYEKAMERVKSGELEKALEARNIPEQIKTPEPKETNFEEPWPLDYFFQREDINTDDFVIRIIVDDQCYNGIDTVILRERKFVKNPDKEIKHMSIREAATEEYKGESIAGLVIPYEQTMLGCGLQKSLSGGKLSQTETKKEKVKMISDILTGHFILGNIYAYKHKVKEFEEIEKQVGFSNTHIPALTMKLGECYQRASILAAMYRNAGIESRIVALFPPSKEQWAQACEELGDFKFESDSELVESGFLPEYIQFFLLQEFDEFGKDSKKDFERIKPYIEGKKTMRFDPEKSEVYRNKMKHTWVEAKIESGWTDYDTNRLKITNMQPNFLFHKVVEIMQPDRKVMKEVRISQDKKDFEYK